MDKIGAAFGCWLIVFIWTAVVDLFWGRKGWLIHLQRWYYCAILLQIAGTLIVYFSFLYKGLSFLAGEYAKIKAAGARKPWKSQINAKLI